jgi:hypothetical protein
VVNVLLVADGYGDHTVSFGVIDPTDSAFCLSHFIDVLQGNPQIFPTTGFTVTRAMRGIDPGDYSTLTSSQRAFYEPHIVGFRFDQHDLSAYDVILLFGFTSDYDVPGPDPVNPTNQYPAWLSDTELQAVAQFMDGGGGVFATGDHGSLGRPLCGMIPRIRSMRKWYWIYDLGGQPRLYGEPIAPPPLTSTVEGQTVRRLDTLQWDPDDPDPSGGNWFDNQSDATPQILELRSPIIQGPGGEVRYVCWEDPVYGSWPVHPLLSGTTGPIRTFPDHMHEGEVITPWETDRTFTFNGSTFVEYPPRPVAAHRRCRKSSRGGTPAAFRLTSRHRSKPCPTVLVRPTARQTFDLLEWWAPTTAIPQVSAGSSSIRRFTISSTSTSSVIRKVTESRNLGSSSTPAASSSWRRSISTFATW